ncbi:DUF4491 family protein [Ventrimonas sp. CLA-AP-H27]|uniref:DUF4491 family protein n=1 Tax=Ventrimonas faecis TaxID=3133170 RepID=A0ABV1HHW0_9FIRM
MHLEGLFVGIFTFLVIGGFHGIVVKTEYYFSKRVWPLFLILGVSFLILSLWIKNIVVGSIIAVFGVTCLWSIKELFEQEKRVQKGWFPENLKRKRREEEKQRRKKVSAE